jgi:hypothetical protein
MRNKSNSKKKPLRLPRLKKRESHLLLKKWEELLGVASL